MQIVYSRSRVANADGRQVKNPAHFTAPVEGATKVYLNGEWPRIREAYEKAGVSVADIGDMRALPSRKADAPAPASEPKAE